jgi:hypothetical protein
MFGETKPGVITNVHILDAFIGLNKDHSIRLYKMGWRQTQIYFLLCNKTYNNFTKQARSVKNKTLSKTT